MAKDASKPSIFTRLMNKLSGGPATFFEKNKGKLGPMTVGKIVGVCAISMNPGGIPVNAAIMLSSNPGAIYQKVGATALRAVGALGPLVGGIVGSVVPGAGTAVGAGVGSAAAMAALAATKVEDEDASEVMKRLIKGIANDPEVQAAVLSTGAQVATTAATKGKVTQADMKAIGEDAAANLARKKLKGASAAQTGRKCDWCRGRVNSVGVQKNGHTFCCGSCRDRFFRKAGPSSGRVSRFFGKVSRAIFSGPIKIVTGKQHLAPLDLTPALMDEYAENARRLKYSYSYLQNYHRVFHLGDVEYKGEQWAVYLESDRDKNIDRYLAVIKGVSKATVGTRRGARCEATTPITGNLPDKLGKAVVKAFNKKFKTHYAFKQFTKDHNLMVLTGNQRSSGPRIIFGEWKQQGKKTVFEAVSVIKPRTKGSFSWTVMGHPGKNADLDRLPYNHGFKGSTTFLLE